MLSVGCGRPHSPNCRRRASPRSRRRHPSAWERPRPLQLPVDYMCSLRAPVVQPRVADAAGRVASSFHARVTHGATKLVKARR